LASRIKTAVFQPRNSCSGSDSTPTRSLSRIPSSGPKSSSITSHAGTPAIIYFDPSTDTALAFGAVVNGQELSFKLIEKGGREWLQDDQTGTLWIPFTGHSYGGELVGNTLERLHAVNAFWFAWNDFYPDTEIWGLG
jgi:hypothetical protein